MPHVCGKKKKFCSLVLSLNNYKEVLVLSPQELQTATFTQSASLRDFACLYTGHIRSTRYGFLIEALSLRRRIPQTAERHVSLSRGKFKACSCFWEANVLTALRIRTPKARLSYSRRYSAKRSPWRILHPQTLLIISQGKYRCQITYESNQKTIRTSTSSTQFQEALSIKSIPEISPLR